MMASTTVKDLWHYSVFQSCRQKKIACKGTYITKMMSLKKGDKVKWGDNQLWEEPLGSWTLSIVQNSK
jgi:hypothetical protein